MKKIFEYYNLLIYNLLNLFKTNKFQILINNHIILLFHYHHNNIEETNFNPENLIYFH